MIHFRNLWVKQIEMLDHQGGLALKAMGMRITYVNVLQVRIFVMIAVLMIVQLHPNSLPCSLLFVPRLLSLLHFKLNQES